MKKLQEQLDKSVSVLTMQGHWLSRTPGYRSKRSHRRGERLLKVASRMQAPMGLFGEKQSLTFLPPPLPA